MPEENQAAVDGAEKETPIKKTMLQALEAMLYAVKCTAVIDSRIKEHIEFVEQYIEQERPADLLTE